MLIEILRYNMTESIEEIQKINSELLGIYTKGQIPEDFGFENESINQLWDIDRELESVLGIQHRPFDWFCFERVEWNIEEMARNKALTEDDLNYIQDVRAVNQGIINAYYDIIDEENMEFHITYDEKPRVIGVYKELVNRAKVIASSQAYKRADAYEVSEARVEVELVQTRLGLNDARIMAGAFTKKVTDEIPIFEVEEDEESYEFQKKSKEPFEEGIYNIRVDKNGRKIWAYLTCKGGGGAYSEEKIDEKAKTYIEQLVPEQYFLYNKECHYDNQKLEEIAYDFIHYDGTYYDGSRTIGIVVDNLGYLDHFDQGLNDDIINMPTLVTEDAIKASIKGPGFLRMILVRNDQDQMEYWVYMKSNGATYTLVFDALTGEQKEVLSKSPIYYDIKTL
jgi:hypothetical protein